jgi:glycosyltransferase involved in cell wall biosynthesis
LGSVDDMKLRVSKVVSPGVRPRWFGRQELARVDVRRIKILYVIGTLDVGGTERQLVALVTRLDRRRFEPTVCCLTAGGPLETGLRDAGIPVTAIGFRGLRPSLGLNFIFRLPAMLAELARFGRLVRREHPDIVHGFLFWAYVLAAPAARLAFVPTVLASRRSLGLFKAGKWHYLWLERLTNRLTDLVVANSEAVKADAIRQERLDPDKVLVIHNGVDLGQFSPGAAAPHVRRELRIPTAAKVVTVVANFIHYKGHEAFLSAWQIVVRKLPGSVALLVGDGPLRLASEARAADLGVAESVRFLGIRDDVTALLSAADVVVHPSQQEGFSNAILEAMAAGRPVVTTAVGGNSEAVVHEETGLLVPVDDSDAMAAAMLRLLEHPAEAAALGAAGRSRIEAHFDLRGTVRAYERLYERLASARAPSGAERGR